MAMGTLLLAPQPGQGVNNKLVSPLLLLWDISLLSFACWQGQREHELAAQPISSAQLQRHKIPPPETPRRSSCTPASPIAAQFTTNAPMAKPSLFSRVPVAADSAVTLSCSAGRVEVKSFMWFPAWTLWSEQNFSVVSVPVPLKQRAQGCAGLGWQRCHPACSGVAASKGRCLSCGLSSKFSRLRKVFFSGFVVVCVFWGFFVLFWCFFHFFSAWNQQ